MSRRPRIPSLTDSYVYPQYLRQLIDAQIDQLPQAAGVYTFHGDDEHLPLYIGKSVNIRARVLSHLRTEGEMRMLAMTRRISHIRTSGEIGALLLEAKLVKQQQPLFNKRLRRNRHLCAWRINGLDGLGRFPGIPALELVDASRINFAIEPGLYGLYGSRHAAVQAMLTLADDHRLCLSVLGLEQSTKGHPCFRYQIKKCAGACSAHESLGQHHTRLMHALQDVRVSCWPHEGAVALKEMCPIDPSFVQFHVVRNWCYLGSAATLDEAKRLDSVAVGFDGDGYKVLCRPMLQGEVEVIAL
jgi:excinuclease Cho